MFFLAVIVTFILAIIVNTTFLEMVLEGFILIQQKLVALVQIILREIYSTTVLAA